MTNAEAIATVNAGGRIDNDLSLHKEAKPEICGYVHKWRAIICDGKTDQDVVECFRCGEQRVTRCTFDDEDFA